MKNSTRPKRDNGRADPAGPPGSRWRMVGLVLCLAVAFGGSWAVLELVVWNKLPGELVGKWVVEGGEQDGATFDFFRGGSMVGRINMRGMEGKVSARVSVEDGRLLSTTRNPHTGEDETRTQIIKTLTSRELVLEDERGQVLRMTRAN